MLYTSVALGTRANTVTLSCSHWDVPWIGYSNNSKDWTCGSEYGDAAVMSLIHIDSYWFWIWLGFTRNSPSISGMGKGARCCSSDGRFGFAADIQQLHAERRAAAKDRSLEGRLRWITCSRVQIQIEIDRNRVGRDLRNICVFTIYLKFTWLHAFTCIYFLDKKSLWCKFHGWSQVELLYADVKPQDSTTTVISNHIIDLAHTMWYLMIFDYSL